MNRFGLSRRASLKLAGTTLGALLIEANLGRLAYAKSADTLVIGMDISDTNSFDPGHQFVYSAPITMRATYETLVTMAPGEYSTLLPLLAESWELADDGAALVFHLRKDVKFSSGNEMTATDVQFTFDRLRNLKDNPAELASNIASVAVVDPHTVKIVMVDKAQPLLNLLVGPSFVISDSKVVQEHGGTSAADADKTDTANKWLDHHSAGTGPYVLSQWEPNAQIVLDRNDGYWREKAAFKRIVIQHIPESATQILTLERGDIEAAMNLTSAQLDGLKANKDVDLIEGTSLDFVYMTLTSGKELSPALAIKEARQAIAYAIDYDGMIKGLEGGYATRPPSFIPNGLGGATSELTKEIGYRHDPDKAKSLLAKAGLAQGFSFDLYYGDASVAGTTYQLVAQKLQSDLAAVNITANLHPLDQATARSKYRAAELPLLHHLLESRWAGALDLGLGHGAARRQARPLDRGAPAGGHRAGQRGRRGAQSGGAEPLLSPIHGSPDRPGQLHRSLPAGLSGRHPHQHQGLEADGRGMAGRSLRRPSGLSRRTRMSRPPVLPRTGGRPYIRR